MLVGVISKPCKAEVSEPSTTWLMLQLCQGSIHLKRRRQQAIVKKVNRMKLMIKRDESGKKRRKEEKGTELVASRNGDARVKLHRRSHRRLSRSVAVWADQEREMVRKRGGCRDVDTLLMPRTI